MTGNRMAKTAPTKSSKPAPPASTKKASTRAGKKEGVAADGAGEPHVSAKGKRLVIVESPAKAKTINKYLGSGYMVKASVGHVRDLPSKNPKGVKAPVPGVDLEHHFEPTYEVLPGKQKTITDLKRSAREASEIWFATDLDREGEAIAWDLAEELGVKPDHAKRVVFNAITKAEIEKAFSHPQPIDMAKVDAQQALRLLDRSVEYQVSPLLWKKVARGLSAGRVQSVAVRLIVEREKEIRAFVPDESWAMTARFTPDIAGAPKLVDAWKTFLAKKDEKGNSPTVRVQNEWLHDHKGFIAELVEVNGKPFDVSQSAGKDDAKYKDLTGEIERIAKLAGVTNVTSTTTEEADGRGPAKWSRTVTGTVDAKTKYTITSIETKRTKSRPAPPFITSTLQQAASTRMGFGAQRTMRAAQRLYEGVEIPGEGAVGLITYMRTDSTHISGEALNAARSYIGRTYGEKYLPAKPNFFSSSNKAAQEAHEAIRPASLDYPPDRVKNALGADELKLYTLIWNRFVSCQMVEAEWDSTAILIVGGTDPKQPVTFRATGRILAFDGFYRAAGVPTSGDEQTLPTLAEKTEVRPFAIDPIQKFSSPPPRFTEASLIKTLESEGIGRPSTYASIISVIQDRKYVELLERRFHATDLGEVVTAKLLEAFPQIMELSYTREMEEHLDDIETSRRKWVEVLDEFYGPFAKQLDHAHDVLVHAKAELIPAPKEYRCQKCGSDLVYRFGKNGRFLSCSKFPACNFACPVDRHGKPRMAEFVNIRCPKTGRAMVRRTGRFGPFITTQLNDGEKPDVGMILNIDKKGRVQAPSPPALNTDLPCPKCQSPLNLRDGVRGPWLGCSRFPKCRGRGKWAEVAEPQRKALEKQLENHLRSNPIPIIRTLDGRALTDEKGKPVADAPTVEELLIDDPGTMQAAG